MPTEILESTESKAKQFSAPLTNDNEQEHEKVAVESFQSKEPAPQEQLDDVPEGFLAKPSMKYKNRKGRATAWDIETAKRHDDVEVSTTEKEELRQLAEGFPNEPSLDTERESEPSYHTEETPAAESTVALESEILPLMHLKERAAESTLFVDRDGSVSRQTPETIKNEIAVTTESLTESAVTLEMVAPALEGTDTTSQEFTSEKIVSERNTPFEQHDDVQESGWAISSEVELLAPAITPVAEEPVKRFNPTASHRTSEGTSPEPLRSQETHWPTTLPPVIEESVEQRSDAASLELGLGPRQRAIDDVNRDSAFVAESPVPIQRRFVRGREYSRDSGAHLCDWGDNPIKERADVTSTALARLSWPIVDEETETIHMNQSQRSKHERSPKQATCDAVIGIAAVGGGVLALQATRTPTKNKGDSGEIASRNRSTTPINRLQTPEQAKYRPGSVGSNRSSARSGTPPLRRSDKKLSGDLRSLSQRSQPNLAKETQEAEQAKRSPTSSIVSATPIANEGRVRAKDMADVYVSEAVNVNETSANSHS
jgi:hypothetical protein